MVCWLLLLSGYFTALLVVMTGVPGIDGGRFSNGALGSANSVFASVVEFWVLIFGTSIGTSASTRDGFAFAANVGGVKVASGG